MENRISVNTKGTLNFVDHVNNEFPAFYRISVFLKLPFTINKNQNFIQFLSESITRSQWVQTFSPTNTSCLYTTVTSLNYIYIKILTPPPQLTSTCSKSAIETQDKLWNLFKVNKKDIWTTTMMSFWCLFS